MPKAPNRPRMKPLIHASIVTSPAVLKTPSYEADCANSRQNVAGFAIAACTSYLSGRAGT
jgi:hypothetical protein